MPQTINHTLLLNGAITVDHARRVVDEFAAECYNEGAVVKGDKESAADFKKRQKAARHMATTMLATQLTESSQQVMTSLLIDLFNASQHMYVEGVTDLPPGKMVDYFLDVVLGDAVGPVLRSKIKTVVTVVVPALRKFGEDVDTIVAQRLGLNGNAPVSNRALYTAAQGLKEAEQAGKLDKELAKEVAAAIREDKSEPEIQMIFNTRQITQEPVRLQAEGKSAIKGKTLTFTITVPEGVDAGRLKDQIEQQIAVGQFKSDGTTTVVHFSFT